MPRQNEINNYDGTQETTYMDFFWVHSLLQIVTSYVAIGRH